MRSDARLASALAGAAPEPFWLDSRERPAPRAQASGAIETDLLVIGGGLTGLWTALQALEEDPQRAVCVLEADRLAGGASGRNGGFCAASLTHGLANGLARWPGEMPVLEQLARENLEGIRAAVARYEIDCHLEAGGELSVATREHELPGLLEEADALRRYGWDALALEREAVRAQVDSPTYLGGVWLRDGCLLLDPARLCWGLAAAVERLGGRLHEHSPVLSLERAGRGVLARTASGSVRAGGAVLATSAFPPLVRAIRRYVIPVYDYVVVTEPLSRERLRAIGWSHRQGIDDSGNRFHYYRLTADDRILFGGYDAIYYHGNDMGPHREQRPASFALLADHLLETFPALDGVRFSHRWGGAIDTCSRFCAMFGRALSGRAVYAVGFTGLGVGASRFAGRVALDLLDGRPSQRAGLEMVRRRPLPFPPEPVRSGVVNLTRRELARADRNGGRRGPWLAVLDRLGLGFDS